MVSLSDGHCYVPSNVGHENIYDVDSIVKSDFTDSTTAFHFQIKEVIESIFTDNEGRPTIRLERYKRSNENEPWIIHKVWSANITTSTYEKKEDNVTYIKLIFPTSLNKKWNGNAKNDLEEKEYEFTSLNVPENLYSFSFDSSLTVLQADFADGIISKDYEIEKFAAGVGMIFKESFTGEYKSPMPPGMSSLEDSLDDYIHYTETIISYNK